MDGRLEHSFAKWYIVVSKEVSLSHEDGVGCVLLVACCWIFCLASCFGMLFMRGNGNELAAMKAFCFLCGVPSFKIVTVGEKAHENIISRHFTKQDHYSTVKTALESFVVVIDSQIGARRAVCNSHGPVLATAVHLLAS